MQDAAVVDLGAVPETLLWTLYHRAAEARRADAVLRDERAIELVERIDYPFEERFGSGDALSQWQALRVKCFDGAVREFLTRHPDGLVVALGEGLETQFWRVDNGRVRWLTVDLPEVVALRQSLVAESTRQRAVACSVLDRRWFDAVDGSRGVLLTAQGLFMYLSPADVHRLVADCAERFRGASLVFDAVPRWLSQSSRRRRLKTSGGYEPPPWSWGLDADEERRLRAIPHVVELRPLRLPRGRGVVHGALLPAATSVPWIRRLLLSVLLARFG